MRSRSFLVLLLHSLLLCGHVYAQSDPLAAYASDSPEDDTRQETFRSIDIGGRKLRYLCEGTGEPTVVLESSVGLSFEEIFKRPKPIGFQIIFSRVKSATRVCVYDRANLGHSDPAPTPRTMIEMTTDLHALLKNTKIRPPYILVGQSSSGMNVRLYAGLYPQGVKGIVLIDSSHPDQWDQLARALPPETSNDPPVLQILRRPPDSSFSAERLDFARSIEQVRAVQSLGSIPLVVLSHRLDAAGDPTVPAELRPIIESVLQNLQRDLLHLSTHSEQIIADKSEHAIQLYQPDLVIDAIVKLVNDARSHH